MDQRTEKVQRALLAIQKHVGGFHVHGAALFGRDAFWGVGNGWALAGLTNLGRGDGGVRVPIPESIHDVTQAIFTRN